MKTHKKSVKLKGWLLVFVLNYAKGEQKVIFLASIAMSMNSMGIVVGAMGKHLTRPCQHIGMYFRVNKEISETIKNKIAA
jgi:hypothetical protein